MNKRQVATTVAVSMLHTDYTWGGNDPRTGVDCSGFVIEILRSVGKLPLRGRWNSHMLSGMFNKVAREGITEGCLVFFGSKDRITHVEYCLSNELMLGAAGGDSSTVNSTESRRNESARVRVRPISIRRDYMFACNPFGVGGA